MEKQVLSIGGMTCVHCQNIIEKTLRDTSGITKAKVSYSAGTAVVTYDPGIISIEGIAAVIEELDYKVLAGGQRQESNFKRVAGTLLVIVSLYILLERLGLLNMLVPSQLADSAMGYGMLFVVGLITSVHCIAMCGGINLSQSIPSACPPPRLQVGRTGRTSASETPAESQSRFSAFIPTFLYNFGRVVSYTAVGFVLGFAGMLFGGGSSAGLPLIAQGMLKLIAGVFMIIMGINMLGLFPWLRKLQPRMPRIFASKDGAPKDGFSKDGASKDGASKDAASKDAASIAKGERSTGGASKGPLFVGLLNGLMPCGPLQSIQILALASGNPITGAVSMFMFSLGTVPLMLGLGSVVSALGAKFTKTVMTVGAVLVVVLGLAMLSQGVSLSGLLSPAMLLSVVIALCAAGVVSSYGFRKPSHKAVSTVAALGITGFLLLAWNPFGAIMGSGSSGGADGGNVQIVDGRQVVHSVLSPWEYPSITVQAGMPVEWIIDAPDGSINGCNNRIFIREYGIEHTFHLGENIIEFTPEKTGQFQYACWMGMIRSTINVVEA